MLYACVQIGDFGMARDLMNENYYIPKAKGGKIPIRWTAPEVAIYSYSLFAQILFSLYSREVHDTGIIIVSLVVL